jgi:hypothetical protein
MDKNTIKKNARIVLNSMKRGYQYTLNKLQEITTFGSTELCLAILILIQEKKIEQYLSEHGVRYTLC